LFGVVLAAHNPSQTELSTNDTQTIVLVEGISDQVALEELATRRGRNLETERISVVPIGGAQAIGNFLDRYGPQSLNVRLAGLCDAGGEGDFRRGLERAGLGSNLTREEMPTVWRQRPRSVFVVDIGTVAMSTESRCTLHGRWCVA
jgi:hypothetical protein